MGFGVQRPPPPWLMGQENHPWPKGLRFKISLKSVLSLINLQIGKSLQDFVVCYTELNDISC